MRYARPHDPARAVPSRGVPRRRLARPRRDPGARRRRPGTASRRSASGACTAATPGTPSTRPSRRSPPPTCARLRVAWTYHTGDARADGRSQIQCNPVVVDGVLYATSAGLKAFALDAATGPRAVAVRSLRGGSRGERARREPRRRRLGRGRRAAGPVQRRPVAVRARRRPRGKPVPGFGRGGRVDLREGLGRDPRGLFVLSTTPGAVYRDLLILGTRVHEGPGPSAPGHVRAYDVRTGAIRWTFHTIPGPGEPGHETWPPEAWKTVGGANAWSGISVDHARGLVFVPTGSPGLGLLGRRPPRREPLRQLRPRAAGGDRRARLALPGRPPRPVGPRPAAGARARHGEARAGARWTPSSQATKSGHVFVFDRETRRAALPGRGARGPAAPT